MKLFAISTLLKCILLNVLMIIINLPLGWLMQIWQWEAWKLCFVIFWEQDSLTGWIAGINHSELRPCIINPSEYIIVH